MNATKLAIANQFPDALSWDWYFLIEPDHSRRGPFIVSDFEAEELRSQGKQLIPRPMPRPTVVITYQEVMSRYPRLVKLLQWSLILSSDEAACCIRDYLRGHQYSGEAVSWCGRTTYEAIADAVKRRDIRHRLTYLKLK